MALEYKLCKPANLEIFIPEKILMSSKEECTSSNTLPFFFPNGEQKHILNNFVLSSALLFTVSPSPSENRHMFAMDCICCFYIKQSFFIVLGLPFSLDSFSFPYHLLMLITSYFPLFLYSLTDSLFLWTRRTNALSWVFLSSDKLFKKTFHSFMFKYLILIKFANLFPALKKIAFLKHRASVLLAEASLCSIPPNVLRSGSLAPGNHPLPAQWPHLSLSITTLPKMVRHYTFLC